MAPNPKSVLTRISVEGFATRLGVLLLLGSLLVLTAFVVPELAFDVPEVRNSQTEAERGSVRRVLEEQTQISERGAQTVQRLEVSLSGRTVVFDHSFGEQDARRMRLRAGDDVLVSSVEGPGGERFFVVDYARDSQLWILGAAFAALVVVVGRLQGVMSLFAMAASLIVILRFIIPGIISGHDPVAISVAGAIVIMLFSLYFSHGINRKTTTAFVGTAVALGLTAALAALAVDFARLSGLAEEQAATVNILTAGEINSQGLLLAGMIIGALGVLDDVTVAQASSVFELHSTNPVLRAPDLFRRAMNIGRDHIASTVNTLFLAYAGAALPLLILLSLQAESMTTLLSREFLAVEVIRTLVGSIGIVASVPLTTALASFAALLRWSRPDRSSPPLQRG